MNTERAPLDPQTSTDVPALMQAAFQRINAREFDAARAIVDRLRALDPESGMTAHAQSAYICPAWTPRRTNRS